MEESNNQHLVSKINELPLSSTVINELFFMKLTPEQIANSYRLQDCNNLNIWRKYFYKHFTDEYNEYIQSLFRIYKETPAFYYNRISYMVLRKGHPYLGDIQGIRRNEPAEKEDRIKRHLNGGILNRYIIADIVSASIQRRDFRLLYQLLTHKVGEKIVQNNMDIIVAHIVPGFYEGFEITMSIEFIELAYLFLNINPDDLMEPLYMEKEKYVIFGTRYYLDSIKNLVGKKQFEEKIGSHIVTDPNNNVDILKSFIIFSAMRNDVYFSFKDDEKKIIIHHYSFDDLNIEETIKIFIFFFLSSLCYMNYDEKTVQKASILLNIIFKQYQIIVVREIG